MMETKYNMMTTTERTTTSEGRAVFAFYDSLDQSVCSAFGVLGPVAVTVTEAVACVQ